MGDQDMLAAMTNKDAEPLNVEPSFAGQICCISIHIPNKILLLNCPGQLYNFLHSALRTSYGLGIDKEQGQQWITLNGTPFMAPGPGQYAGPRVYCALFRCMLSCGWQIVCGSTISLRVSDVHSMFFEKARNLPDVAKPGVCALNFVNGNLIQLTDAPLPLVELLRSTLDAFWKKGEKNAITYSVPNGSPQFKLAGAPWDCLHPSDLIATRTLVAQIISKFKAAGYSILASCPTKISNAGMRPEELDTWIIQCPAEISSNKKELAYEAFKD